MGFRWKTTNVTTHNRQSGGSGMAPPQIIISPPQPQQDNSLLSSFITSKMLNESNLLNSRTNMTAIEPTREQPSYFNAKESIIPKLPDTPNQKELIHEVKPPPPPPPPPKQNGESKGLNLTGLSGRDAMLAELRYAQSDEGKAEKAKKKEEKANKKTETEIKKKEEKEAKKQQHHPKKAQLIF